MTVRPPAIVRLLAALGAAAAAGCGSSDPVAGPLPSQELTVAVVVVDSLMPQEITAATPMLLELKTNGTFYDESRAVFSAETLPNHVAMMTGVNPARNGIPTNDYLDFSTSPAASRRLSAPERLTATTLFTWIKARCRDNGRNPGFRTAATLSKKYLFDIFAGDAAAPDDNDNPAVFNAAPDTHWDPQSSDAYIGSPDEHTPDTPTMDQALTQLPEADFIFVNLGDVDRLAHASGEQARNAALANTDAQVRRFVDALRAAGRWDSTVMILLSDHGMDYTPAGPAAAISTQATLDALGACYLPLRAVPSGQGTDGISVLDRSALLEERQRALRAARACLLGTQSCDALCPGAARPSQNADNIAAAWYLVDDPLDPAGTMPAGVASRHANIGDLVLSVGPGGKFAEPSLSQANGQIPGHHGHPATFRNTFIVAGGSPWVKKGRVIAASVANPGPLDRLPEQSETIDVAPTIAWLLGLDIDVGTFPDFADVQRGFDGRILKEAFVQFDAMPDVAAPSQCGRFD